MAEPTKLNRHIKPAFKLFDTVIFTHPTKGRVIAEIVSTLDNKGNYLITGYGPRVNQKQLFKY